MGVLRDLFQHGFQGFGQTTQALELGLVAIQLGLVWQLAVQQQIGHFFKLRLVGQFLDVIATIGQAGTAFANGTQSGFTSGLSTQTGTAEFLCFCHLSLLQSVVGRSDLPIPVILICFCLL